jgi:glycosyltransferase involved in cell wall biosynthesis
MLKIAIDARMLNNSGIGTYIQNMIPKLLKNYDLVILGRKDEIYKFPWSSNVSMIEFNNRIYSIGEQLTAPTKIPRCDIFISPHYIIPILPIKAKKRIVIIHDVYHLAFSDQLTLPRKLYAKLMMYFAVKLSDRIITVSQFSRSEILKYNNVDDSRISVIYPGFDFNDISENLIDFEYVRNKYELPSKYLLFVGNVKPHKNLYTLLLAFEKLLKRGIELKLVIVGEFKKLLTSDKSSFKLIENNKLLKASTLFTGYVKRNDLILIYKNAEALILPSFYEGFGIPPIEAMACGCPVIASNVSSIPEVCGDAAFYFDPLNINDMESKITKIILDDNLRKDLIRKGLKNVSRFSGKYFSDGLDRVINSLKL